MDDAQPYLDQLVAWRRHLHQYPEVSFEEHETVAYIEAELRRELPEARFTQLTPTSLVASIDTGRPGPKLGLRADIDALAIQEERPDLEFASRIDGRMHACGHDGHTATMMAAGLWVRDHVEELEGSIHLIFQHAEETPPGGAKEMVATGWFDDFDFIYGFHYWATLPLGTVDVKDGFASSNSDLFSVELRGSGGHASTPQHTVDPVVAAAQLVGGFQTIVSRRVAPLAAAVVSTTWVEAGRQVARNVIPGTARLGGSVRSTDPETRELIRRSMEEMCAGMEAAHPGLAAELDYLIGYDGVWNDPAPTAVVRRLARAHDVEVVAEPPMLGGEDFAAFSKVAPATYVFVGAGSERFTSGHHTPTFGIDEGAFPIALQLVIDVVRHGPELAAVRTSG